VTWIDIIAILLIVAYGVGGFFTGVIRRLIGFIALYVGLLAGTNMGLQAGGILQTTSNFAVSDGRIYGFFGIVFGVLVLVEGATQLAHAQIQIPALALNRTFGAIAGLITAVFLVVVCVYELGAAANPFGGNSLDNLQLNIREAYNGSHVIVPIVGKVQKPIVELFQPALPGDSQIYFGPGPVSP
jgi:uncharacterized membrane protein required for colicin V production